MLERIADPVAAAVRAGLPAGTTVVSGPLPPLTDAKAPVVAVDAVSLVQQLPGTRDDALGRREAVYALHRLSLTAPPGPDTPLVLPQLATGALVEVQCPPGRLLPADAYILDGRTLHFLAPHDSAVIVVTKGDAVRGYAERMSCTAALSLAAWAPLATDAAGLFAPALAAALAVLAETDVIDLYWPDDGRLRMRLLQPLAQVERLSQSAQDAGAVRWYGCSADISVRGDLETALTLGTPAPEGVIARVDIAPTVAGSSS